MSAEQKKRQRYFAFGRSEAEGSFQWLAAEAGRLIEAEPHEGETPTQAAVRWLGENGYYDIEVVRETGFISAFRDE